MSIQENGKERRYGNQWEKNKEEKKGESQKLIFISFISSIICPCISVDPRSALIFLSSSVSMVGQVILMGCLQIMAYFFKEEMEEKFWNSIETFENFNWCLIPAVIITSFASYLLLEEKRQLICLHFGLGSTCCDETRQFHWACEREYKSLINYYLSSFDKEHILRVTNMNGENMFTFSYEKNKFKSMEALIHHPSNTFEAVHVQKQFWDACYHGNDKVMDLFVKHPQSQKLFLEQDLEGTGKSPLKIHGKLTKFNISFLYL